MLWASLIPPIAIRAIASRASPSTSMDSALQISSSFPMIKGTGMERNSKRWHLETIVGNTLCDSVVAKTNFT